MINHKYAYRINIASWWSTSTDDTGNTILPITNITNTGDIGDKLLILVIQMLVICYACIYIAYKDWVTPGDGGRDGGDGDGDWHLVEDGDGGPLVRFH